jgi:hypothetical protein
MTTVFLCLGATATKRSCPARSAASPRRMSIKTVHPIPSRHTSRRAHDNPETPDTLDRPARASLGRHFTWRWQRRAGRAPARVNPTSKESLIRVLLIRSIESSVTAHLTSHGWGVLAPLRWPPNDTQRRKLPFACRREWAGVG